MNMDINNVDRKIISNVEFGNLGIEGLKTKPIEPPTALEGTENTEAFNGILKKRIPLKGLRLPIGKSLSSGQS
jgi:hypothetical protein